MPTFEFCGDNLYYESQGEGTPVVFLHGLLHRNWMQLRLAEQAAADHRSIMLEFSGHGRSSATSDPSRYSIRRFADEVLALLDHLAIEKAVVHGTSLGANVLLDGLPRYPERLAGAVIEMPVLQAGTGFAMTIFKPLASGLDLAAPAVALTSRCLRNLPRTNPNTAILLDLVPAHPHQAAAVLWGLIESTDEIDLEPFRNIEVPSLVIGHPNDPLHRWSDATHLAEALPQGRILKAKSMLELRFSPERLWPEVEAFYRSCFSEPGATRLASEGHEDRV